MHEHDLQQLGLSEKEAKVYLAVLELGLTTVIQISQKTEINRPTTYVQIENLIDLGLMNSHEKGKKTYFAAEPPERLQQLIRAKQSEIEKQRKRLNEILPELQSLFDTAEERPKVRFYEGKAGIMTMAADIFKLGNKEILTAYSDDLASKTFTQNERDGFEQLRKKRRIRTQAIYNRTNGPFSTPPPPTVEDRYIPADKFPVNAGIDIYDNKIAVYTLRGKLIGAIIESGEIADSLRSIFKLAWQQAKSYQSSEKELPRGAGQQ